MFPLNTTIPSTKAISVFRNQPFKLSIDYANPTALPPGTKPHIATTTISNFPNAKGETKVKVIVKLDVNGTVSIENAEFIDTYEEEVAAPTTPAPAAQTNTPPANQTPNQEQQSQSPKEENQTPKESETKAAPEQTKPEEKKTEVVKKKKSVKSDLPLKSKLEYALADSDLERFRELELKLIQTDKLVAETAESKNAVESYVYGMRSKLSGPLAEFVVKSDAESFLQLLSDTENWLYGDGEDTTKSAYVEKLVSLRKIGDPIEQRKNEHESRYSTLETVRKTIANFKLAATSAVFPKKKKQKTKKKNN